MRALMPKETRPRRTASFRPVAFDLLRHDPEYMAVDLMRQRHRLLDRVPRRDHANIHLLLSCQSYAGDEAGAQVDHVPVDRRFVAVGIEHTSSIGEDTAKIIIYAL